MEQPLNRQTVTLAEFDASWRSDVASLERALTSFYNDIDLFSSKVTEQMAAFHVSFAEGRVRLLKLMNAVDEQVFTMMLAAELGYVPSTSSALWDRLVDAGIIKRQFIADTVAHSDRIIDHVSLSRHLEDQTLHNIFFPPSELIQRYAEKVVSIDVICSDGRQSRGSGFIVGPQPPLYGPATFVTQYIVTCRHNIEELLIHEVTTSSGKLLETGKAVLSENHDLAFIPTLISEARLPPIPLRGNVDVFDEVFTLGFPKVPRAQSALLGHRGEVNSKVDRYMEKDQVLIISNLVAPGSSGGPVLDRTGRCIGMTIQWLEGDYGNVYSRFSAAMPQDVIVSELIANGLYWQ